MKKIPIEKILPLDISFIPIVLVLLFCTNSCEKLELERIINVQTGTITNILLNSCIAQGIIIDIGEYMITQHGHCWSTSQNPTINNRKTDLGLKDSVGEFSSELTGLDSETTYYVRAYATNKFGTYYGEQVQFITASTTVRDYDGNTYQTVQIGNQIWMAENLKTTHYSDGTAIPLVENNSSWKNLTVTDKAYCYYENSTSNGNVYGALYTWSAAMNGAQSSNSIPSNIQGVCPTGWHLPSDSEWKELEMYFGMSQSAADDIDWRGTDEGSKLKESGTIHWEYPNQGATNSSGFTALPAGNRGYADSAGVTTGIFEFLGEYTDFWSSSEVSSNGAWYRSLGWNQTGVYRYWQYSWKDAGLSVRCIKD